MKENKVKKDKREAQCHYCNGQLLRGVDGGTVLLPLALTGTISMKVDLHNACLNKCIARYEMTKPKLHATSLC